jgi:hypothetical protein
MSQQPPARVVPGYRLWIAPSAVLDDPRAICDLEVEAVVCVAPETLPADWPRDLTYVRISLADDGKSCADALRALATACSIGQILSVKSCATIRPLVEGDMSPPPGSSCHDWRRRERSE